MWSVVLPRGDPLAGRDFASAYARLGRGVVQWLADLGVAAVWSPPLALSKEFCLLGARGNVLTVSGRVLGGAAQHLTSRALLHHGTVGLRVDRPLLARLFDLERSTLEAAVTSLSEEGVDRPPRDLASTLSNRLAEATALRRGG